jgi:hypothetical protein
MFGVTKKQRRLIDRVHESLRIEDEAVLIPALQFPGVVENLVDQVRLIQDPGGRAVFEILRAGRYAGTGGLIRPHRSF